MLKWIVKPALVCGGALFLVLAWAGGVHVLAPQPPLNKGELLALKAITDAVVQPVPRLRPRHPTATRKSGRCTASAVTEIRRHNVTD